ncbi:MAG: bifunctional oligoribonuclease/PAP phosphatase NrnA [Tissierellia bacterium]|mgnify:CR=1 FL=1|nr:bifunctional oligoribonuclease/PAP phosphatase NrnA [Tissierellia bacterium]
MDNIDDLMADAIQLIGKSDNILIASHVQPDGDSIGSALALAIALTKIKDGIRVLKVDDIPADYKFLPGIELIGEWQNGELDLFIALDCADIDRLGPGKALALRARHLINIDHHITNDNFGDINIIAESAATGELVYDLIKRMEIGFDTDIATCLYTAISTDTGRFMYSNTSHKTHLIASELLKMGIDINSINTNLYQNRSIERTNLFLDSLSGLEMFADGEVAVTAITQDMLDINNAKLEDTEGIISFIRGIDTVEVACLLKEIARGETKVSMRSKMRIDVSRICNKFGGGGHLRAAGCTIYDDIDHAKKLILDEIKTIFR